MSPGAGCGCRVRCGGSVPASGLSGGHRGLGVPPPGTPLLPVASGPLSPLTLNEDTAVHGLIPHARGFPTLPKEEAAALGSLGGREGRGGLGVWGVGCGGAATGCVDKGRPGRAGSGEPQGPWGTVSQGGLLPEVGRVSGRRTGRNMGLGGLRGAGGPGRHSVPPSPPPRPAPSSEVLEKKAKGVHPCAR